MSVKDRQTLSALFSEPPGAERQSWPEQRARFDMFASLMPVVEGFEATPATLGAIAGEWVRAKAVHRIDAALLYLHGGGYVIGSPKSHRHMLGPLCAASGLPIFAADYRLAPEHPFPAAVDDAVAAYKGLLDSKIAPDKLALAG